MTQDLGSTAFKLLPDCLFACAYRLLCILAYIEFRLLFTLLVFIVWNIQQNVLVYNSQHEQKHIYEQTFTHLLCISATSLIFLF